MPLALRRDDAIVATQVVSHFEPAGAAALLEEEIREALVGTAGTAAGDPPVLLNLVSCYTGLCQMTDAGRLL